MADDDILTVKEISDLLRLHPATVYRLVKQGKIPSFRIGSEWRFRKDVKCDGWLNGLWKLSK